MMPLNREEYHHILLEVTIRFVDIIDHESVKQSDHDNSACHRRTQLPTWSFSISLWLSSPAELNAIYDMITFLHLDLTHCYANNSDSNN